MTHRARAVLLLFWSSTATAWLRSTRQKSWHPAKETITVGDQLGWSPRPTEAPQALLGRMELVPRLDGYTLGSSTCAFVSSDGESFTCLTAGDGCTYSDGYLGCCPSSISACSYVKTTCIDYNASLSGACDLPDDFHTLCCATSGLPSCFTWILSTTGSGNDPDKTFTLLDCKTQSGTGTLLDYDPLWSATHSFPPTSTSSTTTTTATETGSNNDSGGSSTPVGAIAGGVVGGVAALALVTLAVFLLLRRRGDGPTRAQSGPPQPNPQSPPMGEQGQYPQGGYATGYPGQGPQGQQQYDPRVSTFNQAPVYPAAGQYQQYPQGPGQGQPGQQIWQQPDSPTSLQTYGAPLGGYNPSSMTTSPTEQVHSTPSPALKDGVTTETTSSPSANELETVNPVGMESNRAELGGPDIGR